MCRDVEQCNNIVPEVSGVGDTRKQWEWMISQHDIRASETITATFRRFLCTTSINTSTPHFSCSSYDPT